MRRAALRLRWLLLFAAACTTGCRDLDVVTHSYATLAEAAAAGAIEGGWIPHGLPPGTREIREAHDLESPRRWGLFNFPQKEGDALRLLLGEEMSLEGVRCDPPRRIDWWPVLLRGRLSGEPIEATGARAYRAREGALIFVVNWNQGRGYYWSNP